MNSTRSVTTIVNAALDVTVLGTAAFAFLAFFLVRAKGKSEYDGSVLAIQDKAITCGIAFVVIATLKELVEMAIRFLDFLGPPSLQSPKSDG